MVIRKGWVAEAPTARQQPAAKLASRQDYEHCRRVMLGASRNYSFASSFLPADKRRHVEALYAFLRVGDDRVDVGHEGFASPAAAIDHWERSYQRAFRRGTSAHPVLRAYLNTARRFGIPQGVMTPFFQAMKDDLTVTRFPTFGHLLGYVGGSAIPVGRAMTYILGVRPPFTLEEALTRADSLSIAMQLSNFWRDISEDWDRGRVYLPQEDMARFGVEEEDLAAKRPTSALRRLLAFESDRTQDYYQHAGEGVPMLASGRWGVQSGLLIYQAILTSLQAGGFDPFAGRARASDLKKSWLVARAWLQTR